MYETRCNLTDTESKTKFGSNIWVAYFLNCGSANHLEINLEGEIHSGLWNYMTSLLNIEVEISKTKPGTGFPRFACFTF